MVPTVEIAVRRATKTRLLISVVFFATAILLPLHLMAQDSGTPSLLEQAIQRGIKKEKDNRRIINGDKAYFELNRWQVALVSSADSDNLRAQFCGGAVISPEWVVTAAHCIDRHQGPEAIEILSGTDSLQNGGTRSKVASYFVHPAYASGTGPDHDSDIALLRVDPLGNKIVGTPIVGPANGEEQIAVNTLVRVTGWGVTEHHYDPTILLEGIELPYIDNDTCNLKKSYDG